jgi:aspartate aminotransferase-like enzyme
VLLERVPLVINYFYVDEEGLENIFKRHKRLARGTHAAVQAIVLFMVAPEKPANSAQGYLFSI